MKDYHDAGMSVQGDPLNQRQRMHENLLEINGCIFIIIKEQVIKRLYFLSYSRSSCLGWKCVITDNELKSLLCQNADSRSTVLANGLTKYGTSPYPIDHLAFGSCTASTISKDTWDELIKINLNEINWLNVERRFLRIMGLEGMGLNVAFTPSGTDAETFVSHVLVESSNKPLCNILIAPNEIGGGSALAAEGLRFDELAPDGSTGDVEDIIIKRINDKVMVKKIRIRNNSGELLNQSVVSKECTQFFSKSLQQDEQILVHLVAGSKTNVHTPNRYFIEEKQKSIGMDLNVMIDAAQGRFSRSGIKKCLQKGWIVMTTGSKFFGGPPFSSVILFPSKFELKDKWNDDLGVLFDSAAIFPSQESPVKTERLGSLVRWYAALNEIENYYQIPKYRRFEFLKWFEEDAIKLFENNDLIEVINSIPDESDSSSRLLQSNLTIISFKLRRSIDSEWFGISKLRKIHINLMDRNLSEELIHLGQPVNLNSDGSIGVLRLAFGGIMMQKLNRIVEGSGSMDTARQEFRIWLDVVKKRITELLKKE